MALLDKLASCCVLEVDINHVIEGGTNFIESQIKMKEWLPWRKVCHTSLEPSYLPYLIQIRLRGTF